MRITGRKKKTALAANRKQKQTYCRPRDLPKLIGLWPDEIEDPNKADSKQIIPLLRNALRIERQRGKSGHWCYDINRHMALKHALSEEIEAMKASARQANKAPIRLSGSSGSNHRKIKGKANSRIDAAAKIQTAQTQPALFLVLPTASSS